jgi:hypothetical protein
MVPQAVTDALVECIAFKPRHFSSMLSNHFRNMTALGIFLSAENGDVHLCNSARGLPWLTGKTGDGTGRSDLIIA